MRKDMLFGPDETIALAKRADAAGPAPGHFLAAALGLQEAAAGLCGVLQAAAADAEPERVMIRMRVELAGTATALLRCAGASKSDVAKAAFAQDVQIFPTSGFSASDEAAALLGETIAILGAANAQRAIPRLHIALAGERLRRIAQLFGLGGDYQGIVRGDAVLP